jgi:hypothetical protein
MLKLEINGTVHEVEGIDVNVYGAEFTDKAHAQIAVYEQRKDADGFWRTETGETLLSIDTNLPLEDYYDEWYGFSEETAPGDFPGEVLRFIKPFIV